jgi:hypothetical protein
MLYYESIVYNGSEFLTILKTLRPPHFVENVGRQSISLYCDAKKDLFEICIPFVATTIATTEPVLCNLRSIPESREA